MTDQAKMKALSVVGAVCAVLCIAGAVFFPLGQAQDGGNAVAATVNGVAVYENDVTNSIEQQRKGMGLEDEGEWRRYLQESGLTPADVRKQTIDSIIVPELIGQGAAELGVTVDEAKVDEYIALVKDSAENDDEWRRALKEAGFTEESFRKAVRDMFLEQAVRESFLPSEASDGGSSQDGTVANDGFSIWVNDLMARADIVVNDMPANVPYNVSM